MCHRRRPDGDGVRARAGTRHQHRWHDGAEFEHPAAVQLDTDADLIDADLVADTDTNANASR